MAVWTFFVLCTLVVVSVSGQPMGEPGQPGAPGIPNTTPSAPVYQGSYVVVVPSLLRPGRPLDISVQILRSTVTAVTVTARVQYNDYNSRSNILVVQASETLSGTKQGIISLQIPSSVTQSRYTVIVTGSGGLTFEKQTSITTDFKTLSVFIQTDKAMYKPGKTVKFRTVAVYSNLLPFSGSYNITIQDPNQSKIKQWLKVTGPSGVFKGEVELSEQPVLGEWSIHVKTNLNGGKEKIQKFTVAEYVLPKFDVKVKLPPYLLAQSEHLPVKVTSMYTYGKPVKGKAVISVKIRTYSIHYAEKYKYITLNRTIQLMKGVAETKFTRSDLLRLSGSKICTRAMCYAEDQCVADYAQIENKLMYQTLVVNAVVTEEMTNKVIQANATVQYQASALRLKFLEFSPSTFKPGLPWMGVVQMTKVDGSAVTSSDLKGNNILKVSVACYQNGPSVNEVLNVTINDMGLAVVTLSPNINVTRCSLQARYKYASSYKSINKFLSKGKQGIQVTLPGMSSTIKPNTDVLFEVTATENIQGFFYQLLSKGLIAMQSYVALSGGNSTNFLVRFDETLCRKMSPSGRILVWYITNEGEMIVDSIDFNVDGAFANSVSLKFSQQEVKPGSNVSLGVEAYPHSVVGLLAVDQSVLLLGGSNDITHDQVMRELRSYDSGKQSGYCCYSWYWPRYSGGRDTEQVLRNTGVNVLTDGLIFTERINYNRGSPGVQGAPGPRGAPGLQANPGLRAPSATMIAQMAGSPGMADEVGERGSVNTDQQLQEPDRIRTEFPETWIWTEETVDANGKMVFNSQVPDTITSWTASAFALSDTAGLGVTTETAQLTVLRPFFVSLNLPYSVIRGEEIALQVSVFNYMQIDLQVVVTLESFTMFSVREPNGGNVESLDKVVWVMSGDGVMVSFWIVPTELGQIPISVKARSSASADAVERILLVEPEGESHEFTKNLLINNGAMSKMHKESFNVQYPQSGVVTGSERVVFTVIGDMMGPSVSGLDRLLRMPYGCGEQNMVKFAPNIFVLQYLKATDQLTPKIETKALHYLESGYQRQLTYRRKDSSFSAFGNSDQAGSMWLTAFVIRCFNQAKPYILVDQSIIDSSASWIVQHQNKSGHFQEPAGGRVIHSSLQGGSSQGLGMTAYVLATLLENKDDISNVYIKRQVELAISKALTVLENSLTNITSDAYALSLVTYTLTLARSAMAPKAKALLDALATREGDKLYWSVTPAQPVNPMPYWRRYYYVAPSHDIEMTSYALLTYTVLGQNIDGMKIMSWLAMQRNSLGGYRSTQDTVIALQAMSGFESALGVKGNENMDVSLVVDGTSHTFKTIRKDNKAVLQSFEMSSAIQNVEVTAIGTGLALFQMSIYYHQTEIEDSTGIELTVTSRTISNGDVVMSACGRWKESGPSGMVVMQVNMLTSYEAVTDDLLASNRQNGLKRFEQTDKSLILYFDELYKEKETCVNITSVNTLPVANLKEAVVMIYQYYNPEQQKSSFYLPEELKNKQVCLSCPECCNTPVYINKDNCNSMPCQNGGYCIDDLGTYQCICKNGFRGKRCEKAKVRVNYGPNVAKIQDGGNASTAITSSIVSLFVALLSSLLLQL